MISRRELANAIRCLANDAVRRANSGHPGMPMGMADIAEVLWRDYLKHNPANPDWPNRDRFILSNGHGSMLHYALLHLTGYDLSIDDLKAFRQLHSKTPGHPEYADTPGVETTTGPLGQGLANAVGMALAEKIMAARMNRDGLALVDFHTYVFAGDGCLMEGISHEACSLAGTWGLGKLIVFWDDNGISIDGKVAPWFSDNTAERFRSYGWHVVEAVDGHDAESVRAAIEAARAETQKPSLLCCKTTIGYGAPNAAGTAKAHGSPLSEEETMLTRQALGWQYEPFVIPETIYEAWNAKAAGQACESQWQGLREKYAQQYPEQHQELTRRLSGELSQTVDDALAKLFDDIASSDITVATRKASGDVLDVLGPIMPELLGGSADLSGSNNTNWKGCQPFSLENLHGNYIHYGVREFAMAAIMNGLALTKWFVPYGGTFLVFQSYCANATRMSALMKQRVIYVFTHDSIGLGEDGPTHQPVMELGTLRATPGMQVWRPCDMLETVVAWQSALAYQQGPSALILSRQALPQLPRDRAVAQSIKRGGYVVWGAGKTPDVLLMATGSEAALIIEAAKTLEAQGLSARVVSMPCVEVFLAQDPAYQEAVLPASITKRVAVEAASPETWYRFVGLNGCVIGMESFGFSAPAEQLFETFGFTVENIVEKINTL
ncbi:MAG: transketolase [Gammaproteobacteria bacterium CG11_big_fil_rev_8_21_14_0_20_46_22]|nr:MAG: transketolase [Gammaproteobacteria bacterium CG12_big_fil_rev_8_21_14_0_65_46_12]PIR10965.1 MAG: transketolase [Gammaproteobacteria bacterium CG11_big_fil_rev_8_21_14_0_20_46_22]